MKKLILTGLVFCFSGFLFAQNVPGYDKGADPENYVKETTNAHVPGYDKGADPANYVHKTTAGQSASNTDSTPFPETCKSGFFISPNRGTSDMCSVSVNCRDNGRLQTKTMTCSRSKCDEFNKLPVKYEIVKINIDRCEILFRAVSEEEPVRKAKGI
ncbi:MAG: hypothetical protein NTY22_06045 [Proteobacteria bacterium]|nr:hypothetical protein [Pseudomonadota bacterium]